jgi:serine/threonine protein kinase/WD40 repeat protein
MADWNPQANEIFLKALDIGSPDERLDLLDSACAGDSALRAKVEALLDASEQLGSFLELPASGLRTANYEPNREPPGTGIGPYKLLEQIGEGGMGVVYMAEQTTPVRRRVALKIIKPGMDTRQVIARFEAERQALALMDHPSIARVFDAGATAAGRSYFVMELVRGTPINEYCDRNNLSLRERLELFIQVCHAVQHAHQKGIIHRDIKPSNVLVTLVDGRPVPKVIDFGVAKATSQPLTEKTLFTHFAQMIGTPLYMSPEQAEMTSQDIDTRSDIYSLGVLLYELLTGTTPFDQQRLRKVAFDEVRRIIREEEPPRPSTRISTLRDARTATMAQQQVDSRRLSQIVEGDLDWIVMKSLDKDRTRRYNTAGEFAADVTRHLNDQPVEACPPSAAYRFRKFARRNRIVLTAAALVSGALVLGLVISTWQAIRATRAVDLADTRLTAATEAQIATQQQLQLTRQAEAEATRRLFEARVAEVKAGHLSRRVGQRLESLKTLAEAIKLARRLKLGPEHFLELRNNAIAALALPDMRLVQDGPREPIGFFRSDFDDALKLYARAGGERESVSIRRTSDDTEIAALPGSGAARWPQLSRDGQFLAASSPQGVELWKLVDGKLSAVFSRLPDSSAPAFSLDCRQFAVSMGDGSISVYDLVSKTPPRRITMSRKASRLAFDPRGERIAAVCESSVEIRDLTSGKLIVELPHPATLENLAWSPDGAALAVSGNDQRVYIWDVTSDKQTLVLVGLRNGGVKVAFNHAGNLLATSGWDGVLRLWDLRTPKPLFSTAAWIECPLRFSSDDHRIAGDSRDGKIGHWEIEADGGEYRTMVRIPSAAVGYCDCPAIRFDGRLLAVGMQNGVGLWDLRDDRQLGFLDLAGCDQVLFEPSGALLTNGSGGLLRWPVQEEEAAVPASLHIGPPQHLPVPGRICNIAESADGRVLAVSQFDGGRVLNIDRPEELIRLAPHDDARYVSVSPDGRLVATGSHTQLGMKIWEASSGIPVREMPSAGGRVRFSPDGRWLAESAGGLRLWEVKSNSRGPEIGGDHFGFSPDAKLLAVETGLGEVRLVDPSSGQEYARLEDPNQDRASYITFSPDGTKLITTNDDDPSIHVWDLRLLRTELSEMGLDWDQPPFPPAKQIDRTPLAIHIDFGK